MENSLTNKFYIYEDKNQLSKLKFRRKIKEVEKIKMIVDNTVKNILENIPLQNTKQQKVLLNSIVNSAIEDAIDILECKYYVWKYNKSEEK